MMAKAHRVNIIEVPSDVGSVFPGKSRAPAAIQAAGLISRLEGAGYDIEVHNALANITEAEAQWKDSAIEPNGVRNEAGAVLVCHQVRAAMASSLADTYGYADDFTPFQLILGGECLICPAVMSALSYRFPQERVGLLYIDADCDLSVPGEAGGTGNIAGMTLTHLTLRTGALESMHAFIRPDGRGVVDSSNAVLFGLNSESPANKRDHLGYLFNENFRVVTSKAVAEAPETRAGEALKWLEERVDRILVHLDVDVIDPGQFPLGNVPNWTGVGFPEIMTALKLFLQSPKAVGLIIAEVNPDHDSGLRMTSRLVDEVVEGLKTRQGNN